jgi:hypothetical protein
MSVCKACGNTFRKGVIATYLEPGMGPRGAKVCQECARDGMLVVVRKVAPKVEQKVARPDGYNESYVDAVLQASIGWEQNPSVVEAGRLVEAVRAYKKNR